jgi:hypothetical protein
MQRCHHVSAASNKNGLWFMPKPIFSIGLYHYYFFPDPPVEPVEPVAGKVNGCVLVGTVGLEAF